MRGLHFQLTLPWAPDDSLKGARRDSAIVRNLAATDQETRVVVVKGKRAYQRTLRWTEGNFTFNRIRLREPGAPGLQFDIARFDVDEHSPPFGAQHARTRALARRLALDGHPSPRAARLGRARDGTARLGTQPPGALRPAHPERFGFAAGRVVDRAVDPEDRRRLGRLRIKTDRDPRLLDYVLTKLDLRTNASHLKGAMTFAVGGPVLILKDMDVEAMPFDFALIETMSGGPFPQPWERRVHGYRARGRRPVEPVPRR